MTTNSPANELQYRERVIEKTRQYYTGSSLLDSGCGDGEDAFLRSNFFKKVVATDIESNPRWAELKSKKLSFKKCDSEKLPFKNSSFDTVIEKDMLHHASDPEKAMKEMARVAKKRIIVVEANRYNPLFYINLTLMNNHQHFTQKRFRSIIESAGLPFEIKHFSARVCWINTPGAIKFFNAAEDLIEKFPPYRPIIEYNLAILTKNTK
jgi:ubiquinone/menaquinone biosynthesis C-methylase UbiE